MEVYIWNSYNTIYEKSGSTLIGRVTLMLFGFMANVFFLLEVVSLVLKTDYIHVFLIKYFWILVLVLSSLVYFFLEKNLKEIPNREPVVSVWARLYLPVSIVLAVLVFVVPDVYMKFSK